MVRTIAFVLVSAAAAIGCGGSDAPPNNTDPKCQIVAQKPTSTEYTVVGPDGVVYKTKTEAETAMKTVKVCTTS